MSIVIEYLSDLNQLGIKNDFNNFLLENGKSFEYQIYEEYIPNFIKKQQCFNNSFLMAKIADFDYYEGFYICGDIPIPLEHAFNLKGNAFEVSDFTAQKFGLPVIEWFGVKIPKEILEEWFEGEQNQTPLFFYYQKIKQNGKEKKNQSV